MPLPGLLMNRPLEWETQRGVSDHRPPPPPWGLTMSVDLPLGPGKHSHFPVTWSDRPDKPPSHNCGQFIYLDPITALGRDRRGDTRPHQGPPGFPWVTHIVGLGRIHLQS
uniref:Uncharacterized protein n=1 Tax=Lynx canadensis TaxID=61383 RepID=A0A667HDD8_LYNCA